MRLLNWLKPLFEIQAISKTEDLRFSRAVFNAREKSIQLQFKAANQNQDTQRLLNLVLAALPDQNAFHSGISNISNGHQSRIVVFLKPTAPEAVSNEHLRTLTRMLTRQVKDDLTGKSSKTVYFMQPPSNTFT